MNLGYASELLTVDPATFGVRFGCEPFGLRHGLAAREMFRFTNLRNLVARYTECDYFVATGPSAATSTFSSMRHTGRKPLEAFDRLDAGNQRILLKRPETYDPAFHALLHETFDEIVRVRGGVPGNVERLEASVLITSAQTITPFHFDPLTTFNFQIAGDKRYHIYSPRALDERELERFYVRGRTNTGQVSLEGRDPGLENVFDLRPGDGMHQPRNAPHWVETSDSVVVSYSISFETNLDRALSRTRGFNHYLRALRVPVTAPGLRPRVDAIKSALMRAAWR